MVFHSEQTFLTQKGGRCLSSIFDRKKRMQEHRLPIYYLKHHIFLFKKQIFQQKLQFHCILNSKFDSPIHLLFNKNQNNF